MKSLVSLELRKQRKSFFGLLLIIGISLTLISAIISIFSELDAREAFLLITVILLAFGLPFFALLLAGSAGAALRSAERKAEEDIPVRPSKRALASYIASLTYLILLASLLLAFFFGSLIFALPLRFSSHLPGDLQIPFVMVLLFPLHSAAFVFSYWLSQGVMGSAASAIITLLPAYIFYPFLLFGGIDFMVVTYNSLPGLVATIIHLSLMLWLANRIEREKRTWLPMKIGVVLVMVGGLFLGIWGFCSVVPDVLDDARHNEFKEETIVCH